VTLTPTFSGAASVTLGTTQGGSQISSSFASGASIPVQASGFTAATSYWLRATSAGGTHTDAVVTVTPQTVSVGALSPAAPTRTASTVTTFSTTVTGGALGTVTWSASAGTMAATTGVWTAPATAGSVTLTATSVDDPTRSATTTATVVLAPSVSLAASTTSPLRGATNVTVTPTFSNATSAVVGTAQGGSQVSLSPTSGQAVAVQPGGFTTAATYWLRGTNAAASYADASVTVTPQTVSVGAVSPAAPAVLINSTTAFSATVTGGALGTVTWTASAGAINAGTGSWTAPSTANPGVTITATSVDDGTKTASTTVTVSATPPPGITSFTGNPTTISAGQGTLLAYTCTNGSGVITDGSGNTVASGLSGSGSKAVSPGATMTYTLTVTGTGTPATATVTITVLDFVSKWLYVADDLDGTVHGFTLDDATGALAAITGSPWSLAGAATTARNVCTDPQARFVFAVDNTSNLVTSFKINQSTGALARVAGYGTDAAPWGATVDPPGKFLYVRCDGKVDVFSINQTSGVLAATTPASYATTSGTGNGGLLTSNNGDIVVHPSGLFLFSAGQSSGKVDVFAVDPATGALSANLAYALLGSSGPIGVAVDPTGAFVAAKGEVAPTSITTWAFDITTGTLSGGNVSGALDGDNAYNGLCFSPTLDVLYCAYYNLNGTQGAFPSVGAFGIDLGTGALSGLTLSPYTWFTEGTFQGSDNIAVSRNGKWAYATDYEGSQIGFGAVDTATGALATSATAYGTGGGPDCIAIAGVLQ